MTTFGYLGRQNWPINHPFEICTSLKNSTLHQIGVIWHITVLALMQTRTHHPNSYCYMGDFLPNVYIISSTKLICNWRNLVFVWLDFIFQSRKFNRIIVMDLSTRNLRANSIIFAEIWQNKPTSKNVLFALFWTTPPFLPTKFFGLFSSLLPLDYYITLTHLWVEKFKLNFSKKKRNIKLFNIFFFSVILYTY